MNNTLDFIKETVGSYEELEAFSKTREFNSTMTVFLDLKLNQAPLVGKLMAEVKNTPQGDNATFTDWINYYFTSVRTPEQAYKWITQFAEAYKCDIQFATKTWATRILLHTFRGWKNETLVKLAIQEQLTAKNGAGWYVFNVEDEIDRKYAVDLIIKNPDNETVSAIQVKPKSYFLGSKPYTVQERTIINPAKNKQFHETFGAPVFYVIIEEILSGKTNYIKYGNIS